MEVLGYVVAFVFVVVGSFFYCYFFDKWRDRREIKRTSDDDLRRSID